MYILGYLSHRDIYLVINITLLLQVELLLKCFMMVG